MGYRELTCEPSGISEVHTFNVKRRTARQLCRGVGRAGIASERSRVLGESHNVEYGKVSLSVICLLVLTPLLAAQTLITGEIAGTVADPSGGVIPGAAVTLTNNGTGASEERLTNGQGDYRFSLLAPGNYLLTAKATNFAPAQKTVQVQVGRYPP